MSAVIVSIIVDFLNLVNYNGTGRTVVRQIDVAVPIHITFHICAIRMLCRRQYYTGKDSKYGFTERGGSEYCAGYPERKDDFVTGADAPCVTAEFP